MENTGDSFVKAHTQKSMEESMYVPLYCIFKYIIISNMFHHNYSKQRIVSEVPLQSMQSKVSHWNHDTSCTNTV